MHNFWHRLGKVPARSRDSLVYPMRRQGLLSLSQFKSRLFRVEDKQAGPGGLEPLALAGFKTAYERDAPPSKSPGR